MPLVNDYQQVKEIYADAGKRGVGLPLFCSEDRQTLEAILAAAYEIGQEIGNPHIPITPSWTARYHVRCQACLVSKAGNPILGCKLMFSDLAVLTGEDSPYKDLLVMPHLDHANPWENMDILTGFADQFASVMCDASEKPLEENIRLTAAYVEKVKGKVVVEGAVDEISSTDSGPREKKTTVAEAKDFMEKTGVDIIVPNLGTEHRSTTASAHYDSDRAREISGELGKVICLHGSSSVNKDDLSKLPDDGIIKINLYTGLAYAGGKAVVNHVLNDIANVLTEKELSDLIEKGVLGSAVLKKDFGTTIQPIGPKLAHFTNPLRSDAWFNAFKEKCKEYMRIFNYHKFAN